MGIILMLLVLAGVGLVVYTMLKPAGAERLAQSAPQEPEKLSRLDSEVGSLKEERDKLKADYSNLQVQLQDMKKEESDLRDQLARTKEWYAKNLEALEKTKKENLDLRDKLASKEKFGSLEKTKKDTREKITPSNDQEKQDNSTSSQDTTPDTKSE